MFKSKQAKDLKSVNPESAGVSSERLKRIDKHFQEYINEEKSGIVVTKIHCKRKK
jgi:hypothetical protein